jgi:uncharacterized protein
MLARMETWVTTLLVAVAMAIGLAGTVVPLVPGLGLIAAAAAAFGIIEGFGVIGWTAMAVIIVLFVGGTVAGFVLPGRAAGSAGAPRTVLLVGVVGAVIGFFAIPVVGVLVGGVIGIYVGELVRTRDTSRAWQTTKATLRGFGVGALVQLVAGMAMVVTWVGWAVAA